VSGSTCQKQLGAATAKDPPLVAAFGLRSFWTSAVRGIAEHAGVKKVEN
jgi:hypothetical protein